MKTKILISSLFLFTSITSFCATWVVNNSGFTFTPNTITIAFGDSVNFVIESEHNAIEVSQTTYNVNGNTALAGGFQTLFGGGLVLPAKLGVGTHYYVCEPHASSGMKGIIIVQDATGITENQSTITLSVFPNPANDFITVKANNLIIGSGYIVTDQTGKQLLAGTLNNEITSVDISQLVPGVYFFRAGKQRKLTFKVLKK